MASRLTVPDELVHHLTLSTHNADGTVRKGQPARHAAARDDLAERVRAYLAENPLAPKQLVAAELGVAEHWVHTVLDEYDGATLTHVGPGRGGNWLPAPTTKATGAGRRGRR